MCKTMRSVLSYRVAAGLMVAASGAARAAEPELERALQVSPMCFPETMTRAEMLDAMQIYGLRPPAQLVELGDERYFNDQWVWHGDPVLVMPGGAAERAVLTYSFPDDGATWGLSAIDPGSVQGNALNAAFVTHLGDVDRGRELVRQALASWSRVAGLYYREVQDDNSPMDQNTAYLPQRGDIRIGGGPVPGSPYLAYNAFPSNFSGPGFVGGGDMFIDTTGFTLINFNNPANNYRTLRNVVAHEHGHGLGMYHAAPCNQTKLMEPQVSSAFDGPSPDEIRGAARSYNDRFAPNHTFGSGYWLGDLVPLVFMPPPGSPPVPAPRSFGARNLSLNGMGAPNGTDTDWFYFDTSADVPAFMVTATPTGGVYDTGVQTGSGCGASFSTIDANSIGNLELEMLDLINGQIWTASVNGPGQGESIALPVLPASSYAVRISDIGPTAPDQVQLYSLSILMGVPEPPTANPGVGHKRARANQPCWFMGDINSEANAPGASIVSYDWDLDANGVFETLGQAQVAFVYPSSGDYSIPLRVTDSNGLQDERRISVTVHGAVTDLNTITPNYGYRGRNASIQLTGANWLIPTTIQFSGTGIQVVAFGATNTLGTEGGAFLFIDPSTPLGFYDLRVTNAEGVDTVAAIFQVRCVGDLDGDNIIGFGDLNILLGVYNQVNPGHPADFDQNGVIDFADLNFLLGLYNTTC